MDMKNNEILKLYNQLNNTTKNFPKDKNIVDMFKDSVNKYPNNIALSSNEKMYSYKELDKLTNKLGNKLIELGVKKGDFVSIYMERSVETVISILGILKSGGAYVPLDPSHPKERNQYIMEDTNTLVIVTKKKYKNDLLNNFSNNCKLVFIEDLNLFDNNSDLSIDISPNDLAYVIYTSGTTGKPKGTLLKHQGVVNLSCWIKEHFKCNENDVLTQFATYSFDASVFDTFGALFWGCRLHLLSNEERMSVEDFANAIERTKTTWISILPTVFFNQLATHLTDEQCLKFKTVKRISVGGEALTGEIVRKFQKKFGTSIEISNLYGPTEATVAATCYTFNHLIPENQINIPIGKPLNNYKVYIVNEHGELCSINEVGELYIESVGLAAGYLNNIEKTNEVFIKNPFSNDENSIVYKTGDLVKLLEDGNIEYVSRKDSQVKIRGHRIELSEIENNILKYPNVKDVAVVVKEINGEKELIAFYTVDSKEVSYNDIYNLLKTKLPSYMIPKKYGLIEKMPLSPTGKIDRKKLLEYDFDSIKNDNKNYIPPVTNTEKIVAKAWEKVLNLENISVDDDFFEIGGHSLKILEVIVLLKNNYPFIKINDFFNYRTIRSLSNYLDSNKNVDIEIKDEQEILEYKDLFEFPFEMNSQNIQRSKINNILLTGSTGYLGSHILYDVLKRKNYHVYCVVRKNEKENGFERLNSIMSYYFGKDIVQYLKQRVTIIEGDITKKYLGLEQKTWKLLLEKIDLIIHSAADVRHFGDEKYFNLVNFEGVNNLLDLVRENKDIEFHHISTLGIPESIALEGKWEKLINQSISFDSLSMENVYVNSKLKAEKLLYNEMKKGLKISIYRMGNITCRSYDGKFQKNIDSNAFYRMIKSMLLLKYAPKVNWYVDFTPVDYASKIILEIIEKQGSLFKTYHICNPEQIHYQELINLINELGYNINLMNLKDYEKWLLDGNHDKDKEAVKMAITQLEGDGAKNFEYKFSCQRTLEFLNNNLIQCPKVDKEFLNKMFKYAIEIGYFPKGE